MSFIERVKNEVIIKVSQEAREWVLPLVYSRVDGRPRSSLNAHDQSFCRSQLERQRGRKGKGGRSDKGFLGHDVIEVVGSHCRVSI